MVASSTALIVGVSIRVAIKVASKNAAIDTIAKEDGLIFMFAANGHHITGFNDLDPEHIELMCLDSAAVAEMLQRSACIDSVVRLSFTESAFESDALANVKSNPWVRQLSLLGCIGLTPETCSLLVQKFPNLREISLMNSDIEKDGLVALGGFKSLHKIDVTGLSITVTEIVQGLALFPALKHLIIQEADLSGHLKGSCKLPYLEILDVSFDRFSGSDLATLLDCTACKEVVAVDVVLNGCEIESFVHDRSEIVDWGMPRAKKE